MELSEWIRQFNETRRFHIQAEQQKDVPTPVEAGSLSVCWPDGQAWNGDKPFWIEETGQTYETFDEAVDAMGRVPSHNNFGILRFDS